jgi:hypothetical protein
MKYCIILALLCVISMVGYSAEVTKTGTTAAVFLKIDVGARATAMGSSFASVANDATSMFWNPSGIAFLEQSDAIFCHARWIADISINYAGVAIPFRSIGTIGVNAVFMTMDDMERTTTLYPEGTGEMFSCGSYAFALSYGRLLTNNFAVGLNAKYITENIYNCYAHGFAVDVGTLYRTPIKGLSMGMSITNYGSKMRMEGRDLLLPTDPDPTLSGNNSQIMSNLNTDRYEIPLLFRFGFSYQVLPKIENHDLLVSVDLLHPNDDAESVNIGAEYVFLKLVAVRGGYKALFTDDSEEGLCLGAGFLAGIASTELRIDYAYKDFGRLKDVQMFTVGLKF